MKERDLRASFVAALVVESCVGLSFTLLNPQLDIVYDVVGVFHFIPLLLLGWTELVTKGAFSTGGRLFYVLLFALQVLVLALLIYGVLRLTRSALPKRDTER